MIIHTYTISVCFIFLKILISVSSVAQSCPTLCDRMNHSMPGFLVHHQLPESTQTHVHWISDAIQLSHPLSSLILPPSIFPSIRVFQMSQFFASNGQSIGVSASTSDINIPSVFKGHNNFKVLETHCHIIL